MTANNKHQLFALLKNRLSTALFWALPSWYLEYKKGRGPTTKIQQLGKNSLLSALKEL